MPSHACLPYKSIAAALLLSVFLGPVGLLYSSFWGGFLLILLMVTAVKNSLTFVSIFIWVICCMWSVIAAQKYNKRLMNKCLVS